MKHSDKASVDAYGASQGSIKTYLTGFALAILLTVIPFALVITKALSFTGLVWAIFIAAIVQILVHLYFFLHLDATSEKRWNVLALAFTSLMIFLLVGGTLWIMYSLHFRMMG